MQRIISLLTVLAGLTCQAQPPSKSDLLLNNKHYILREAELHKPVDANKFIAVGDKTGKLMLLNLDSIGNKENLFSRGIVLSKMDQTIQPGTSRSLPNIKINYCDAEVDYENNTWIYRRTLTRKSTPEQIQFAFMAKPNATFLISLELNVLTIPSSDKFVFHIKSYLTGMPFDQDFILNTSTLSVSFLATTGPVVSNYTDRTNVISLDAVLLPAGVAANAEYYIKLKGIRVKEL